eukprot:6259612-Karenia_brevis.AAC.1
MGASHWGPIPLHLCHKGTVADIHRRGGGHQAVYAPGDAPGITDVYMTTVPHHEHFQGPHGMYIVKTF